MHWWIVVLSLWLCAGLVAALWMDSDWRWAYDEPLPNKIGVPLILLGPFSFWVWYKTMRSE
jgi:hypothetical protein